MRYNNFNIDNEVGLYITSIKEENYSEEKEYRQVEVSLAFSFDSVNSLYSKRKNILKKIYTTSEDKLYIDNSDMYYRGIISDISIEVNNRICTMNIVFECSKYKIQEEVYTYPNLDDWRGFKYIEVQKDREYYNNSFEYEIMIRNKEKKNFNIGRIEGINGYYSDGFLYNRIDYTSKAGGSDSSWFLYDYDLYSIYINSSKQLIEIKEIIDNNIVDKQISEKGNAYYPPDYVFYKLNKETSYLKVLYQDNIDIVVKIFRKVY